MNTTLRRIAISAPIAVALMGLGVGSAQAAPYEPQVSDTVQLQPVAEKPDIVIHPDWDFDPEIGPDDISDTPDDPIVDPAPPTDEPSDNDDSDNDSDDNNSSGGSSNGGNQGSSTGSTGGTKAPKAEASDEPTADVTPKAQTTEAVDVTKVAEVKKPFPTGLVILIAGGILLALAAFASYWAGNKTA